MAKLKELFRVICLIGLLINVSCQQNREPEWVEDLVSTLVTTGLNENTPRGTVIGSIRARDPENGPIRYAVESDIFSIDSITGQLTLTVDLDREERAGYPIKIIAKDDVGNTLIRSFTVRIVDINDETPTFNGVPGGGYRAEVREDALIGETVLGNMNVTDRDSTERNSQIRLLCFIPEQAAQARLVQEARDACQWFEVGTTRVGDGSYIGTILLKAPLDYEVKNQYTMNIVALDNGSPPRSATSLVTINVKDTLDTIPRFLNTPVIINIFESLPIDTEVGVLEVQDGGRGASRPLRVKIAQGEDGLGWFRLGRPQVDPSRVDRYLVPIYSNGNIDREAFDGVYEFFVEVIELADGKETQSRARTKVSVTIDDRNDNPPSFNQQNYDITVKEGLTRGSPIPGLNMVVRDNDQGRNSEFGLSIENDQFGSFSLSQSTCKAECAISLVVDNSRAFDYEDGNYRTQIIRVIARETTTAEQLASTATVTVKLEDVNDNVPEFTQTIYSVSVREDRTVGSLLATILATDQDSSQFGSLKYRLVGTGFEAFTVNEDTGEIRLARRLDYEQQSDYNLLYEARDMGGRVTRVPFKVTILNFNDQGPIFTQDNYNIVYREGNSRFIINITAVDREQSSTVTYRIVSGNERNIFTMDRFSGLISTNRQLSFSDTGGTGFIRLMVEASDSGNPPQTTVVPITITVQDVNQRPTFAQSIFSVSVPETAPPGRSVLTLTAVDNDEGAGGIVRYLIAGGGGGRFTIDRTSGLLQVAPNTNLDLERGSSSYRLTIQAIDAGNPPMVGEAQVIITITDANNKMPEFIQNVYIASLLDSSPPGWVIVQLVASDPDQNRQLEYSIRQSSISAKDSNGNNLTPSVISNYRNAFIVNSATGVITSRQQLSRDNVGEMSFIAQVADRNAQSPPIQTATATVIITIESTTDRNQQLEFPQASAGEDPTFRVSVPEEQPQGYIVYNIVAVDPNTKKEVNNYQKVYGTDPMDYFFVERSSGSVSLNRRLDYESLPSKELTFQVRAIAPGNNGPLTAIARMVVTIQDINDNSPIFTQQSYRFTVSEGLQFPVTVRVVANDADAGPFGDLRYSLSGKGRQFFYIDPLRGIISVANNASLDREGIDGGMFNLFVKATDAPTGRPSEQRQTEVPLTIIVEDMNDNAPIFSQSMYNFYTRDTSRAGSALGQVKATDRDSGRNGQVIYSIRSGNVNDLFAIDRTSGTLRNTKDLEGYAQAVPYTLEVQASDDGIPALRTSVTLNVFISDLQDNDDVPRILAPAADGQAFRIAENATANTIVTTIEAVARGTSVPGSVVYTFLNNAILTDQDSFSIEPFTGIIRLRRPLDREKKQSYQLIVVVENKLASTQSRRIMYVNVTDINDNLPSFLTCPGPKPTNPLVVSVDEDENEPGVLNVLKDVATIRACDRDVAPYNITYYYIIGGNEPLPGSSTPPFTISRTTGMIRTQVPLDREVKKSHLIYIKASENANLDISQVEFNESDSSIMGVFINVKDVNDNGPSFGRATSFRTGVLATAPYRTKLIYIYARDPDSSDESVVYNLENTRYYDSDEKKTLTEGAFKIGETDGVVYTNIADYLDYQNGYFVMDVVASDSKIRASKATLTIYVLRSTQRLKFVMALAPEDVVKRQAEFINAVNSTIGDEYMINVDSMHYAMSDNALVRSRTDLCFHLIKDNKVVEPKLALELFDDWEDNELREIFNDYRVDDTGLCSIKTVTYWWSDHWWLWWLLIALTLFMILMSLIAICCLCWCWDKYRKRMDRHKPYVVLDPAGFDATKEYEWQERTVKM